jgi:Uma2 family endonuclease
MPAATATRPITTEELLAMPENGVDRWLIRGQLRERPMTVRNRYHSRTMIRIGRLLEAWLEEQPEPRGEMLCGEAGVILKHDPDTTVGVDVVYISAEVAARQSDDTTLIDGVPTLAVEILSPSDTQEDTHEKISEYLRAGVPLVWIVDPEDRTVRIYRPDARPQLFNEDQELTGDPHLPGFRTPVRRMFV